MKIILRVPTVDDGFWHWFLYGVQGIAIAILAMICIQYAARHQHLEAQGVSQVD